MPEEDLEATKHLQADLKYQRTLMDLDKQKMYGIHGGRLTEAEVDISFFGRKDGH